MVFFTSGCVWCFRSGHFGAGNAGHHKKPAEEGDQRGVGKGEAPTSKRTWTRARLPLLEMQVEVKSSGLINLSHVHHKFPGTDQTRKIGRTLLQRALPWGKKHRQKQNGKKKKKRKIKSSDGTVYQGLGKASIWWNRGWRCLRRRGS